MALVALWLYFDGMDRIRRPMVEERLRKAGITIYQPEEITWGTADWVVQIESFKSLTDLSRINCFRGELGVNLLVDDWEGGDHSRTLRALIQFDQADRLTELGGFIADNAQDREVWNHLPKLRSVELKMGDASMLTEISKLPALRRLECEWKGSDGRARFANGYPALTSLQCWVHNRESTRLDVEVANLPLLETADLRGVASVELSDLPALTELAIDLSETRPDAAPLKFSRLPRLESATLLLARLDDVFSQSHAISNLKLLSLSSGYMENARCRSMAGAAALTKLEKLGIHLNDLTGLPAENETLPALKFLDISKTQLGRERDSLDRRA